MKKTITIILLFVCLCSMGVYRPQTRVYNSRYWNDTQVPAFSTRLGVTAPSVADGFGGVSGQYYIGFVHTQTDEVYFTVQLPHDWIEGTALYPHIHYTATDNQAGASSCIWKLDYQFATFGGTYGDQTSITFIGQINTNGLGSATAWKHQIASTIYDFPYTATTATIATAGKKLSSILVCKLSRVYNHTSDNYDNTVAFLGFDIHYQTDGTGSRQEYIK